MIKIKKNILISILSALACLFMALFAGFLTKAPKVSAAEDYSDWEQVQIGDDLSGKAIYLNVDGWSAVSIKSNNYTYEFNQEGREDALKLSIYDANGNAGNTPTLITVPGTVELSSNFGIVTEVSDGILREPVEETNKPIYIDFDESDNDGELFSTVTGGIAGWTIENGKMHPIEDGAKNEACVVKYNGLINLDEDVTISFDACLVGIPFEVALLSSEAENIWGNSYVLRYNQTDVDDYLTYATYIDDNGAGWVADKILSDSCIGKVINITIRVKDGIMTYAVDGNVIDFGTQINVSGTAYLMFRAVNTNTYIDNIEIFNFYLPTDLRPLKVGDNLNNATVYLRGGLENIALAQNLGVYLGYSGVHPSVFYDETNSYAIWTGTSKVIHFGAEQNPNGGVYSVDISAPVKHALGNWQEDSSEYNGTYASTGVVTKISEHEALNYILVSDSEVVNTNIQQLDAPELFVSTNGKYISWRPIDNAIGYMIYISGATSHSLITDTQINDLTDGTTVIVRAVGDNVYYMDSESAEITFYGLVALDTPTVSVSESGLATWPAVENSAGYGVVINGTQVALTYDCEYQLTESCTIQVFAQGDNADFKSSEYSEAVAYEKIITQLATPVLKVNHIGVYWESVLNATGYVIVVDGTSHNITYTSYMLSPCSAVKVKAVGDNNIFIDSEYSEEKTYYYFSNPTVNISLTGLATWGEVEYATKYVVTVNGSEVEYETNEDGTMQYQLSNGDVLKVYPTREASEDELFAINDNIPEYTYTENKLQTPKVTGCDVAYVYWSEVDGATGYEYVLDGFTRTTTETHTDIYDTYTFKVKAVGDGETVLDSDYTTLYTYYYISKTEITIDENGLATWEEVGNATGYEIHINGALHATNLDQLTYGPLNLGDVISVKPVRTQSDTELVYYSTTVAEALYGLPKLATPIVTVGENGLATWPAVENATKYIVTLRYPTFPYTADIEQDTTSIQLHCAVYVSVTAIGDTTTSADSLSSTEVYYDFTMPASNDLRLIQVGDDLGGKTLYVSKRYFDRHTFIRFSSGAYMTTMYEYGNPYGERRSVWIVGDNIDVILTHYIPTDNAYCIKVPNGVGTVTELGAEFSEYPIYVLKSEMEENKDKTDFDDIKDIGNNFIGKLDDFLGDYNISVQQVVIVAVVVMLVVVFTKKRR